MLAIIRKIVEKKIRNCYTLKNLEIFFWLASLIHDMSVLLSLIVNFESQIKHIFFRIKMS